MESTRYTPEEMAKAKGATLFEVGKNLHVVNALYADDPHIDLIIEGWQEAVGKSIKKPRKFDDIEKYSPTSPISEMSLADIHKRVLEANKYLSFTCRCTASFNSNYPRPGLEIGFRADYRNDTRLERVEEFQGWLRGLCFADAEPRRPTLEVDVIGDAHGWACKQTHLPMTEDGSTEVETVATFPTMPGATCFCDAVKAVFDAIDSGWRKAKL